MGYNLYYGWLYQNIPGFPQVRLWIPSMPQSPDIPLMVTEYGADTYLALHSYLVSVKDYTEDIWLLFSDNALRAFEERDFMVGSYVWRAWPTLAIPARNEGGKTGQNQKGLVIIGRQLKKDAFYLLQSLLVGGKVRQAGRQPVCPSSSGVQ